MYFSKKPLAITTIRHMLYGCSSSIPWICATSRNDQNFSKMILLAQALLRKNFPKVKEAFRKPEALAKLSGSCCCTSASTMNEIPCYYFRVDFKKANSFLYSPGVRRGASANSMIAPSSAVKGFHVGKPVLFGLPFFTKLNQYADIYFSTA